MPPKIEICILDGFGGGDCVESDGSKKYRAPSEMLNYWATNQPDMNNFSAWCYDAGKSEAATAMRSIATHARTP